MANYQGNIGGPDFNGFCNLCPSLFPNARAVQKHQKSSHRECREICPVCHRRFPNRAEVALHGERRGHGAQGRRVLEAEEEAEEADLPQHNINNN